MDDTLRDENREIDPEAILGDSDLLADDILGDLSDDSIDDNSGVSGIDDEE